MNADSGIFPNKDDNNRKKY